MTMPGEPIRSVRGENVKPRHERRADDWYVEEPSAVHALFDAERFSGVCWDPACGQGTIPRIGKARGIGRNGFYGTDLHRRGYSCWKPLDFLSDAGSTWTTTLNIVVDNLIFNPPFAKAQAFVEKALTIATHKVAALNRLAWIEGQGRSAWLQTTPLARVYAFPWRLNMPPGDHTGPRKGGAVAFAWFVWEIGWQGPPQLRWLTKPTNVTADRPQDAA